MPFKEEKLLVKKRTLLLIAALVWMIAGLNIVRIGFIEYIGYLKIMNFIFSAGIFIVFWVFVFKKLVNKHTKRILTVKNSISGDFLI